MTLEEAKQLKPGDIIHGSWGPDDRTIVKCGVSSDGGSLLWSESKKYPDNLNNSWSLTSIILIKAAEPQVINTYPIF